MKPVVAFAPRLEGNWFESQLKPPRPKFKIVPTALLCQILGREEECIVPRQAYFISMALL